MPTTFELLKSKREEILALAEKHGVTDVRVFGSVARGEDRPDSDIDLLISYTPQATLLKHAGFMSDLESMLHRKVDVVQDKRLHWVIRDDVLKEAKPL